MKNRIHIIAFDIPFPANYGGVIDVYYKIKALSDIGLEVILHCFSYGNRGEQEQLKNLCKKVYYYPRRGFTHELWKPYIVGTRKSDELLKNLLLDDAPIFFEAIHCCYLLDHPALEGRRKMVRMHNIEHDYYELLAKSEKHSILRKAYYFLESIALKNFEKILCKADVIYAISKKDQKDLQIRFGEKVKLLPPFHGNDKMNISCGRGDFCFYHGKLSVAENHEAAMFLVEKVFLNTSIQLKIAGDGVSRSLRIAVENNPNVELLENLSPNEINQYIQQAHINVIPTFQPTGIKLKLINVLFQGRYLVVNTPMVAESGLEQAAIIVDDPAKMIQQIENLMKIDFNQKEINKREVILGSQFDNHKNALIIKAFLEGS